ncbi:asparaginase [soil metagenome]
MQQAEPSNPAGNSQLTPLAVVTRADRVESVHAGTIVVADASGRTIASVGNPETIAYFRSSAKPFQAIPLIESGAADAFKFTDAELALCCASHHAEPRHQQQVAAMLGKIGLSIETLQCGISLPGDQAEAARVQTGVVAPSPLQCDCSGKHTGMLAVCVHLGYSVTDYLDMHHPLQVHIRQIMAEVLRVPSGSIAMARDGCSLPTFGASIRSFAQAYATLAAPSGSGSGHAAALDRLRHAMMTHPENVSGTGSFVTGIMEIGGGRIVAKTGAEGLICLGVPDASVGIAIRVADGSFRVHPEVVAETLRQLGLMDELFFSTVIERHPSTLLNHNGWEVGEIRPSFTLSMSAVA